MERLHNKLDTITTELGDIKLMLVKNTVILDRNVEDIAKHIKRTDLLEQQIEKALFPAKLFRAVTAIIVVLAPLVAILHSLGLLPR